VLLKVIEDERAGKYQGQTVQIVPHVMSAIQDYIRAAGEGF
jgi:CTP synthase (UTP-ammonia lyase)